MIYYVTVRETQELWVEVSASSKAEAREKARNRGNWIDWDESPAYIGNPTPTRDPVVEES